MNDSKSMVLGTFANKMDAENAIKDLERNGYNPKEDISFISYDKSKSEDIAESTGARVGDSAATGAGIGAGVGEELVF